MKKLRLIVTKKCNRRCKGCCNKDWDLDNLPIATNFDSYDEIIITGGEPLLFGTNLITLLHKIKYKKQENGSCRLRLIIPKIYLYTAQIPSPYELKVLIGWLDGITLTLHNQKDATTFTYYQAKYPAIWNDYSHMFQQKSMRLNIFKGVYLPHIENWWRVKKDIKWIDNCPLPRDEEFKRLEILW